MNVVEKILALHVLEHDVVVVVVLKQVNETYYVRMLAHLEHFDLPPLLEHLNMCHVSFLDLFDSHFLAIFFVECKFHKPKLSLAQGLVELVILRDISRLHGLLKLLRPLLDLLA